MSHLISYSNITSVAGFPSKCKANLFKFLKHFHFGVNYLLIVALLFKSRKRGVIAGWLESVSTPVDVNRFMNDSKPVPHGLLWPEVDSLKEKSHGLCQALSIDMLLCFSWQMSSAYVVVLNEALKIWIMCQTNQSLCVVHMFPQIHIT